MSVSDINLRGARASAAAPPTIAAPDPVREFVNFLPRPIRFLGVGMLGLITDIGVFSIALALGAHPLEARLVSIAVATFVTWRLNRALTFQDSGDHPAREALRYGAVTLVAQGTSYVIFAALVLTTLGRMPQAALLIGAAVGAVISYSGHRFLSFAPRAARPQPLT